MEDSEIKKTKDKMNELKQHYGKIAFGLSVVVTIIVAYIILHYLAYPEFARNLAGGFTVAFPLYLKHEVFVYFSHIFSEEDKTDKKAIFLNRHTTEIQNRHTTGIQNMTLKQWYNTSVTYKKNN